MFGGIIHLQEVTSSVNKQLAVAATVFAGVTATKAKMMAM